MRFAERATPVAAVVAAMSTLACCLPFGFLAAAGLAGTSVWVQSARPWLLIGAALLLVFGFIQLYRKRHCNKRSAVSLVLFWVATVIVLTVILFPQAIASLIAG
jgi:hypothetical protein